MEKPKEDEKLEPKKKKRLSILGATVAFSLLIGLGTHILTETLPGIDRNPGGTVEKVQTIGKETVKGRQAKGKREKYAILLNSGAKPVYPAFYTDITLAFDTLRKNGFSDENIIVLNEDGKNRSSFIKVVDYAATYENLQKATQEIAQKIDGNDVFFMYVTDHGSRNFLKNFFKGESIIPLRYGKKAYVNESELEKMLEGITKNAQYSVMVFNQCFSGGFAERLGKDKTIAISVCRKDKTGLSSLNQSPFSSSFFSAQRGLSIEACLEGLNLFGAKTEADLNKDGKVSIEEAFDYAAKNDPFTQSKNPFQRQTPQLRYGNLDPTKTFLFDDPDTDDKK